MECFAGLATAGFGAKTAFDYNRANFLYDRELRQKKEFQVQNFRVKQAAQWREDVRDLISLTEYKMHVYLLVLVLLLGVDMALWCQGRLNSHSFGWLMTGHAIACAGVFMFLLLFIWMAMHAAVSAQGFETRLLTQLVRLPIPSWQEVEACRTYASDFEQVEPRQMFRLPLILGRQERLIPAQEEETRRDELESPSPSPLPSPLTPNPGGSHWSLDQFSNPRVDSSETESNTASEYSVNGRTANAADPWGLERWPDDMEDLGQHSGTRIAALRHIRLTRQAMVHWQSFDAYARICLSVGVGQLLLSMSYYLLGHLVITVGSRSAPIMGVLLLTCLGESLMRLDMSLITWQLLRMQLCQLSGPILACVAAMKWLDGNPVSAEVFAAAAFAFHALSIGTVLQVCRVLEEHNGTMLPVAFQAVLYLDVFGWFQQHGAPPAEEQRPQRPQRRPQRQLWEATAPTRPEDFAPGDKVEDCRSLPGAPRGRRNDGECFNTRSWLQKSGDDEEEHEEKLPEDQHDAPRTLPHLLFTVAMATLCGSWIASCGLHLGSACLPMSFTFTVVHQHPAIFFNAREFSGRSRGLSTLQRNADRGYGFVLEPVSAAWPHSNVAPHVLACNGAGQNLVASDGFTLFGAELQADTSPAVRFKEASCDSLAGEGVQDVAVSCPSSGCAALVLHRLGRRLSSCSLGGSGLGGFGANISDGWLERRRGGETDGSRAHARIEKANSLAMFNSCKNPMDCLVLGTSRGRVVSLRSPLPSSDSLLPLYPAHSLRDGPEEGEAAWPSGALRTFQGHLAVGGGKEIRVLDRKIGEVIGSFSLPKGFSSTTGFCVAGDSLFMFGEGKSPMLWRVRLPSDLLASVVT